MFPEFTRLNRNHTKRAEIYFDYKIDILSKPKLIYYETDLGQIHADLINS